MRYLIDTNICIYVINEHPPELLEKFKGKTLGEMAVSTITISELQYGVSKSQSRERNARRLAEFLVPFELLPYDAEAARCYGDIRWQLERAGEVIGPLDMLLAAQALSCELVMVSNNEDEFRRVPSLKVENWVE